MLRTRLHTRTRSASNRLGPLLDITTPTSTQRPYAINVSTVSLGVPSGITNGEWMFAHIFVGNHDTFSAFAVTPPAGWSEINTAPFDSSGVYTIAAHAFMKKANNESGTYDFTLPGLADAEGFLFRTTNVDANNPIDTTGTGSTRTSTSGTYNISTNPGLTTLTDKALVVWNEQQWDGDSLSNIPSFGTLTMANIDHQNIGNTAVGIKTTAGATGTGTRTNNNSNSAATRWVVNLYALRPARGP